MKIAILAIFAAVLVLGCTEEAPITEVSIPGHGNQIYAFHNDIRESLKVPVNNPEGIRALTSFSNGINLVFDGSSGQDNSYFTVVTTELAEKLPVYFSYEGRLFGFRPYYYIGEQWYDADSNEIEKPQFAGPVLWMLGPSTGANETSLTLVNSTIYLQGTSYKNLTLAGDKFALVLFDIDRI